MPKTETQLHMGERYDKKAQEHLRKAIEHEEMALNARTPADREKYGEEARQERDLAIEALEQAKIAYGPESEALGFTAEL